MFDPSPGMITGLFPLLGDPLRVAVSDSSCVLKEKKTLGKNTVGEIDCDVN